MEKTVIFGPLIIFFGFFAFLVFCFFAIIINIIKKSKNEEWSGVIIDKKHNQFEDMDDDRLHDNYFLVVKIDGKKDRNVGLSRILWEGFKIGDKIIKPKGKLFPQKQ